MSKKNKITRPFPPDCIGRFDGNHPVSFVPAPEILDWVRKVFLEEALTFATTNKLQLPAVVQSIRKGLEVTVNKSNNEANTDQRCHVLQKFRYSFYLEG